jgi:hypothetical protein
MKNMSFIVVMSGVWGGKCHFLIQELNIAWGLAMVVPGKLEKVRSKNWEVWDFCWCPLGIFKKEGDLLNPNPICFTSTRSEVGGFMIDSQSVTEAPQLCMWGWSGGKHWNRLPGRMIAASPSLSHSPLQLLVTCDHDLKIIDGCSPQIRLAEVRRL